MSIFENMKSAAKKEKPLMPVSLFLSAFLFWFQRCNHRIISARSGCLSLRRLRGLGWIRCRCRRCGGRCRLGHCAGAALRGAVSGRRGDCLITRNIAVRHSVNGWRCCLCGKGSLLRRQHHARGVAADNGGMAFVCGLMVLFPGNLFSVLI